MIVEPLMPVPAGVAADHAADNISVDLMHEVKRGHELIRRQTFAIVGPLTVSIDKRGQIGHG